MRKPRFRGPTVMIANVTVRYEAVRLPVRCPGCKERLSEVRLDGWEYQDQGRACRVEEGDGESTIDFEEDDLPRGGETFISWVGLYCQCGRELASGDFTDNTRAEAPPQAPSATVTQ